MLHHELKKHRYHYTLLIIVEAFLLSIFVNTKDPVTQMLVAIVVGTFYFLWGIMTHAGTYRPLRLVLEYAVIGLLGSIMLFVLIKSV